MDWTDVEERLNRAKATFLSKDRWLLKVAANERSMTHKFAEYLQQEFTDWDVDCEYNRKGDVPKTLRYMFASPVDADDTDAKTVFPDIIVHRRGEQANLLVIEAKKSGRDDATDRQKLTAFMNDSHYEYSYAVFLCFATEGDGDILIARLRSDSFAL
jgi:hypothetical protein